MALKVGEAVTDDGEVAPTRTYGPPRRTDIESVLDRRAVGVRFQPLVHLHTGEILGYEALARGPLGTTLEAPNALFGGGRGGGPGGRARLALPGGGVPGRHRCSCTLTPIFLNTEPGSLRSPCPEDVRDVIAQGETRLRVMLEVNERDAAQDPAAVLATVSRARSTSSGSRSTTGRRPPAWP